MNTPHGWTRADLAATAAAAAMAMMVASAYEPKAALGSSGWWNAADQERYLRSAVAWAAGRLDPSEHWYMPGYPALAAPFIPITRANPFLLPDIALLVATIWLAAAIGGWLAPCWRWTRPVVAVTALASVLPPLALKMWVMPWTSTPETPLTLAALLAGLHLMARPARWQAAFWAGLCAGALLAFRPVDALVVCIVVFDAWLLAMLRAWPGPAAAARTAGAGAGGAALGVLPALAAYWAINGWQLNGYLTLSEAIGFEWRLLPLQWVTIMLSPRPLYPDGAGLISGFPWIATGIAGIAACLVKPPWLGGRLPHLLVGGAVCLHVMLYLCYRDLHPQGLWRYENYHYFKWALLILAVYSLMLVMLLLDRQWRAVLAGITVLMLLLPWRAELVRDPEPFAVARTGSVLRFPSLSLGVFDAIVVPADGSFDAIYNTQHNLYVGAQEEKWYSSTAGFKIAPQAGGLIIAPLRPFSPGPVTIHFGPGVSLGQGRAFVAQQHLVFGVPCWLPFPVSGCL